MKTVMNHSQDGWLLKMISRTDPVILYFWNFKNFSGEMFILCVNYE